MVTVTKHSIMSLRLKWLSVVCQNEISALMRVNEGDLALGQDSCKSPPWPSEKKNKKTFTPPITTFIVHAKNPSVMCAFDVLTSLCHYLPVSAWHSCLSQPASYQMGQTLSGVLKDEVKHKLTLPPRLAENLFKWDSVHHPKGVSTCEIEWKHASMMPFLKYVLHVQ